MGEPQADVLAWPDRLRSADADDLDQLVVAVKAAADPQDLLLRLAADQDPEVRGWVPSLAAGSLGTDAIPLVSRLSESDDDPDVRGLAMDALERLEPSPTSRTTTVLLRRLNSPDASEVIRAGWRLAALHDERAVGPLRDIATGPGPAYVRKAASVQVQLIVDPTAIPAAIRGHDHDRMPWLAHGATLVGTADALDAVRWAAGQLPDEACRDACARALAPES